mgnify:CR=1 FL=1
MISMECGDLKRRLDIENLQRMHSTTSCIEKLIPVINLIQIELSELEERIKRIEMKIEK